MDELLERLTELEIRFTHQQQLLDELNSVVIEQARHIARLEQEHVGFREMFHSLAPTLLESPDE